MDELGWTVAVAQTRSHETAEVMADMAECDRRADTAKNTDNMPPLTPDLARQNRALGGIEAYRVSRPNATRMLVYCLQEPGYRVVRPVTW